MSGTQAGAAKPGAPADCEAACTLRIDWLEFSVKHLAARELGAVVHGLLGEAFAAECWEMMRNDKRWQEWSGPEKTRLREDRVGQANRYGALEPWAGVRLPGGACRLVGTPTLLRLLAAVHEVGVVKVSRIDLALDDPARRFTPKQFAQAVVDGSLADEHAGLRRGVVTRVQPQNWDWSRREGGCFWLGGKKSARLLRVYDKGRESKGEIDAVRVELQSRDDYATALARDLLQASARPGGLREVFASYLVAFVDLREPRGDRSQSQTWPRVVWWQQLVGDARAASIGKGEASGSLAWFRGRCRQVRGFLQVTLELFGVEPVDLVRRVRQGDPAGRRARGCRAAPDPRRLERDAEPGARVAAAAARGPSGRRRERPRGPP